MNRRVIRGSEKVGDDDEGWRQGYTMNSKQSIKEMEIYDGMRKQTSEGLTHNR